MRVTASSGGQYAGAVRRRILRNQGSSRPQEHGSRWGRCRDVRLGATLSILLSLLAGTAVAAQWKPAAAMRQSTDHVANLANAVATGAGLGYATETCIIGGNLDPGQTARFDRVAAAGIRYAIVAAGSDDVTALDLVIRGPNNQVVSRSSSYDGRAISFFRAETTGDYTVEVSLERSPAGTAYCSLAILAEDGQPMDITDIKASARGAIENCARIAEVYGPSKAFLDRNTWTLHGCLIPAGGRSAWFGLSLGPASHVFAVSGSASTVDVDLSVMDRSGAVLATDREGDSTPVAVLRTPRNDYGLEVLNGSARESSLVIAVIVGLHEDPVVQGDAECDPPLGGLASPHVGPPARSAARWAAGLGAIAGLSLAALLVLAVRRLVGRSR